MLPPSVGGTKDVTDYFKLFDNAVKLVADAARQSGAK